MLFIRTYCLLAAGVWLAVPTVLVADEPAKPKTTLTRPAAWTTVFAEEETSIDLQIAGEAPLTGRVLWSLSSSEGLQLIKGEVPANGAAKVELRVKFPNVKPGVVFTTLLTARYYLPAEREPVAQYQSPIYVYPTDPLHDRHEVWQKLRIKLYDPAGPTAKTFEEAKLPYEQIHNLAAIGELSEGLIVVGEGVSFREDRSLPELLVNAAANGVPVLCLAPIAGEFEIPRVTEAASGLVRLSLKPASDIRQLDKRLDDRYWMKHKVVSPHVLNLSGRGSHIVAELEAGQAGWPWMELEFISPSRVEQSVPAPPTKLIALTLPVIEHWKAGPTPRFLLSRLVESITLNPVESEEKGKPAP